MLDGENRPRIRISDPPISTIQIQLPKVKHEISVKALFLAIQYNSDSKGVMALQTVKEKLGNLVALQVLGDQKQSIIDQVNAEILRKGYKLKPVSAKELKTANETRKGGLQVTFGRKRKSAEKDKASELNISYFQNSKTDPPTILVFGLQKE